MRPVRPLILIGVQIWLLSCHLRTITAITNTVSVDRKLPIYTNDTIASSETQRNSVVLQDQLNKLKNTKPITFKSENTDRSKDSEKVHSNPAYAYAAHHNHPAGVGFVPSAPDIIRNNFQSAGIYNNGGYEDNGSSSEENSDEDDQPIQKEIGFGHYDDYHYGNGYGGYKPHPNYHFNAPHHPHFPVGHNIGYHHDNHENQAFHYKELALKSLLIPLAGVALLGAAAALITNPVLVQLGVISGKKRRRRNLDKYKYKMSKIYPRNDFVKPM